MKLSSLRNKIRSLVMTYMAISCMYSCGHKSNSHTDGEIKESVVVEPKNKKSQRLEIHGVKNFIYTDSTYVLSSGKRITIQNSFPKGGMIEPDGTQYVDASGKQYAFAAFWTRIVNETTTPIELSINFPPDSFAVFTPPDAYIKLFLPTATPSFDKLSQFNYGLTDVQSFLDSNFYQASGWQKSIGPKEDYVFYVATLSYGVGGTPRAALIMKGENLYYNMSIEPYGSGTIPCGKIEVP